jgi:hypothetical protein
MRIGSIDDNFSSGWYSYRGSKAAIINTLQPHKQESMNRRYLAETVSRRDADVEPPWTGSRRVSARPLRFMSPDSNGTAAALNTYVKIIAFVV